MGYHIHESGIALDWLKEVVGDVNPLLGGLPPEVILQTFLYQLRAFANAGFCVVVVISGHNFGQQDLRLVAEEFMRDIPVEVVVRSDPELVAGTFEGDHAGRYELSQLLHLRPDLVNLARASESADRQLGRFALGSDAGEATEGHGQQIIELSLLAIQEICRSADRSKIRSRHRLSYVDCDRIWTRVHARRREWQTLSR
jgi:creatinine amidohydrolase